MRCQHELEWALKNIRMTSQHNTELLFKQYGV